MKNSWQEQSYIDFKYLTSCWKKKKTKKEHYEAKSMNITFQKPENIFNTFKFMKF